MKKRKKKTPAAVSTSENILKSNIFKLSNLDDDLSHNLVIDMDDPGFRSKIIIGENKIGLKREFI